MRLVFFIAMLLSSVGLNRNISRYQISSLLSVGIQLVMAILESLALGICELKNAFHVSLNQRRLLKFCIFIIQVA